MLTLNLTPSLSLTLASNLFVSLILRFKERFLNLSSFSMCSVPSQSQTKPPYLASFPGPAQGGMQKQQRFALAGFQHANRILAGNDRPLVWCRHGQYSRSVEPRFPISPASESPNWRTRDRRERRTPSQCRGSPAVWQGIPRPSNVSIWNDMHGFIPHPLSPGGRGLGRGGGKRENPLHQTACIKGLGVSLP